RLTGVAHGGEPSGGRETIDASQPGMIVAVPEELGALSLEAAQLCGGTRMIAIEVRLERTKRPIEVAGRGGARRPEGLPRALEGHPVVPRICQDTIEPDQIRRVLW